MRCASGSLHRSSVHDCPLGDVVLARIAEDEAHHAALAWRTAQWLIAKSGDPFRAWARAGTLGALARATIAQVIEPCARTMLQAPPNLGFAQEAASSGEQGLAVERRHL